MIESINYRLIKTKNQIIIYLHTSLKNRTKNNKMNPKYIPGVVNVKKVNPSAEYPTKRFEMDPAFDVTLIARKDNRSEDNTHEVNYFHTGLMIVPPHGYHVEFIADEKLHFSGYTLATGLSVHSMTNQEVMIPLIKFKEVEDIQLPFRGVKMIIRQTIFSHLSSVENTRAVIKNRDYDHPSDDSTMFPNYPQGARRPVANPKTNYMM